MVVSGPMTTFLADVAVLADFRSGKDVGKVPDFGAFADRDMLVNNGGGVDEDVYKWGHFVNRFATR